MLNRIKHLFCQHDWKLLRWRWFHADYGICRIETKCECLKCGKVQRFVVPYDEQKIFVKTYPELEV